MCHPSDGVDWLDALFVTDALCWCSSGALSIVQLFYLSVRRNVELRVATFLAAEGHL